MLEKSGNNIEVILCNKLAHDPSILMYDVSFDNSHDMRVIGKGLRDMAPGETADYCKVLQQPVRADSESTWAQFFLASHFNSVPPTIRQPHWVFLLMHCFYLSQLLLLCSFKNIS